MTLLFILENNFLVFDYMINRKKRETLQIFMKLLSDIQGINVKSGEQLSSFQLEDLVGMLKNAEKSRTSFCYT